MTFKRFAWSSAQSRLAAAIMCAVLPAMGMSLIGSSIRRQKEVRLLTRVILAAVAMILALRTPSAAEGVWQGPNGGMMIDAGSFHIELLVKNTEYRLNIYDHVDKPVAVAQATAVLTVMVGEEKEKLSMQPVGPNSLAGQGAMKRSGAAKVLVLLRVPDQASAIARFDVP